MTTMTTVTAPSGSWAEAVTNKARAFLQLKTLGSVRVYIGSIAPGDPGVVPDGIVMSSGEVEELDFSSLEAGDSIYVTSMGDDDETIGVVHSDAAPA